MMTNSDVDRAFRQLFSDLSEIGERAPSSLKARLYSAVIQEQQASGPLASLDETVAAGHDVCVFEKLVQIAPIGQKAKSPFFCQVCHARILAEGFDNPPIFWAHCPYVEFKGN
jgi:hypothetical protein